MHEHGAGAEPSSRADRPGPWGHPLGHWIVMVALLVLVQVVFSRRHAETLPYSEFKALVAAGKLRDVVIEERTISGQLLLDSLGTSLPASRIAELRASGDSIHAFTSNRVEDPALVADLQNAKVRFAGKPANPWFSALAGWILPALFFLWLLRGMGRMGARALEERARQDRMGY